jgi:hypothetical protein
MEIEDDETTDQIQLFSPSDMVIQELRSLKLTTTTPLDALNTIAKWQKQLGSE